MARSSVAAWNVRPSFIPRQAVRELRDLTRRRKQLFHQETSGRNREQKVLDDANIKLGPGATHSELTDAMEGHIFDRAELMGTYQKKSVRAA